MFRNVWRQAALAMGAALLTANFASADDTIRLIERVPTNPVSDIALLDLRAGDNADTLDIRGGGGGGRGGGGGFRGGGFRGGFGGYRGGYRGGFVGYRGGYRGYGFRGYGYRGFGYGYPRYYGGFGLGLGLGYGLGYGYGGGYGGYYGYPYYGYSSYSPYGYYGISADPYDVSNSFVTTTIPYSGRVVVQSGFQNADTMPRITVDPSNPQQGPQLPIPQPRQGGTQTFPYDGGPSNPIPVPMAVPKKTLPAPSTPDRAVSLPATKQQYTYRAYGEPVSPKPATTLIAVK